MRRDLLSPKIAKIDDLKERLQIDLKSYMEYLENEGIYWDGDFFHSEEGGCIENELTAPAQRAIDHLFNHWEIETPSNMTSFEF